MAPSNSSDNSGHAARMAVFSQAMMTLVEQGMEAQQSRNGRELAIFEKDFDRVALLADALMEGNYRDTAARLAGIAESGVRAWIQAADSGDTRYAAVANLIRSAEALAEAECVSDVRKAGKDPRFWAASMTWLERKWPDRYGRRQEDTSTPRIVVQIGVKDGDVQVQLGASPVTSAGTEVGAANW